MPHIALARHLCKNLSQRKNAPKVRQNVIYSAYPLYARDFLHFVDFFLDLIVKMHIFYYFFIIKPDKKHMITTS